MVATATAPNATAPAVAPLRFPVGARLRESGQFYDETRTMAATAVVFPEASMPPGDWLTDLTVWVKATTAENAATVAFEGDAPWNAIAELQFLDAAGNAIASLTGFGLYLVNLLGGFYGHNDPTDSPLYTAPTTGSGATGGSFEFGLHVPVEIISRDAIGAIPNGASNSVCRVRITLADTGTVYSTNPTSAPSVRIRMFETGYVIPASTSVTGLDYATQPPGAGTFQQFSEITYDFTTGRSGRDHTRKGQVYRTLIIVARDSSGDRSDSVFEEFTFSVDDVPSLNGAWDYCRHRTWQRHHHALSKLPTGVIQVSYAHEWDGIVGGELRDWWVQTQPGTNVNFRWVASAAGKLQVITNEIVPVAGSNIVRG